MPIKLLDTNKQVVSKIRKALYKDVKRASISYGLRDKLQEETRRILLNHLIRREEYKSLMGLAGDRTGHSLRTLFGLGAPEVNFPRVIRNIVETWVDSVRAKGTLYAMGGSNARLWGRIVITAVPARFEDVLNLKDVSFVSSGKDAGQVDWLNWLLTRGSEIVVATHTAIYKEGVTEHWSRTREAMMTRVKNKPGWSVPHQYAGTIENNWPTRTIADMLQGNKNSQFSQAIISQVKRTFGSA